MNDKRTHPIAILVAAAGSGGQHPDVAGELSPGEKPAPDASRGQSPEPQAESGRQPNRKRERRELLANVVRMSEARMRCAVPVCGPYQQPEEDWMLMRVLEDYQRAGRLDTVILVNEKGSNMSGHRTEMGVSVWRLSTKA